MTKLSLAENFKIENFRNGVKVWEVSAPNVITLEGKNFILQTFFGQGITTLYVGLIDLTGFIAVANTDTAAQINGTNGWKESVAYSNTTRQTYFAGTATAQSIDNSAAKASFTMNTSGTIHGAFVCSSNVKNGTSGSLINAFVSGTGNQAFIPGDVIQVTVTYAAS